MVNNIVFLYALEGSFFPEYLDPSLFTSELEQLGAEVHKQYGNSLFWKLFSNLTGTSSMLDKTSSINLQSAWQDKKRTPESGVEKKIHHITRTNNSNENRDRKKHARKIHTLHTM